VLTAAQYTDVAENTNLISFDMGGTTAKVCLIEEGRPALTGQFEVDMVQLKKNSGLPISIPAIDLVEIGSGGGSIARIEMGAIAVGPESAGSVPGPIAYDRGGTRPTVTDADLLLGYLDPDYFLGGQMSLDVDAAKKGIEEHIARPLGIDVIEAAWGVYEVVTSQMAQAARVVSVGKGKDPRNFALIPFGGAGPVHGARLAKLLGCSRIVFPARAGVMSAIGLLTADVAFDLARTHITPLDSNSLDLINNIYDEMQADGKNQLVASGIVGKSKFVRSADMRFVGQGYEIGVDLPDGAYAGDDLQRLSDAFFKTYAETYGDRAFDRSDSVEIVHYRITATAVDDQTRFDPPKGSFDREPSKGTHSRPVFFSEVGGFSEVTVHRRNTLIKGQTLHGPLVVEEPESTVIIPPGSTGHVDQFGNIVIDLKLADGLVE
jgi:N-methylhydantoinase A